jgi:hypothetical protein
MYFTYSTCKKKIRGGGAMQIQVQVQVLPLWCLHLVNTRGLCFCHLQYDELTK